jgi:glycosyltransferase involved in cell wall biosynthesis
MRILVATDAWHPQVNGVVRSLESMAEAARQAGNDIQFLTPQGFAAIPLPSYPEISLALVSPGTVRRRIESVAPDHIHIATEGSIGYAVRRYCWRIGHRFTTSYHTRFPEYVAARWHVPESWTYA